jgi:hypothetical protein
MKLVKHSRREESASYLKSFSDQYPGCPHGSSEEQRKDYEQRKLQARRQLIMREHFNRINNLPQGYFYESEEETEYRVLCLLFTLIEIAPENR